MDLAKKRCIPCEGGTKPMGVREARKYLRMTDGWKLRGSSIYCDLQFKDFAATVRFANKVADATEHEGHHPDIYLHSWNRLRLTLSTHAIKGLSINDFILASKINRIMQ